MAYPPCNPLQETGASTGIKSSQLLKWSRHRGGIQVNGAFQKTKDENVWRLEETEVESGHVCWTGLVSVYVDDIVLSGEEEAVLQGALRSLSAGRLWNGPEFTSR